MRSDAYCLVSVRGREFLLSSTVLFALIQALPEKGSPAGQGQAIWPLHGFTESGHNRMQCLSSTEAASTQDTPSTGLDKHLTHISYRICPAPHASRAAMLEQADRQKYRRSIATICALPNEILGDIIRPLSFKDKCSLELSCRCFNSLLSRPLPTDGLWGRCDLVSDLWGRCDLVSDLKLDRELDSRKDIMR